LTVRLGGEDFTDDVNITKSADRERFVASVRTKWPGLTEECVCAFQTELEIVASREAERREGNGAEGETHQEPSREDRLAQMPASVRAEAEKMLEDPELVAKVSEDIEGLGVAGERDISLTIFLVGVSRLLLYPLAAILQGLSSSGKSFLIKQVARLFSPESVILATQISAKALFHMPAGSLSHKFVVCGERSRNQDPEAAETTRALREMLSEGRLSMLVTLKDAEGRPVARRIEQEGPIAYVESTSLSRIFDEDANRCLILSTDERRQQTRLIMQKTAATFSGSTDRSRTEAIIERHHAMQRLLEPHPVVVPFAERIEKLISADPVQMRRAFPQLLGMVQASALLHQRQRKFDSEGRIIAEPADWEIARKLMLSPMNRIIGRRASEPASRFYERLRERVVPGTVFATSEAIKGESATDRAVRGWLGELVDVGLVELVEPRRGPMPAKWKVLEKAGLPEGPAGDLLPRVESVFSENRFQSSDGAEPFGVQGILSEAEDFSGKLSTDVEPDCWKPSEETPTSDRTHAGTTI